MHNDSYISAKNNFLKKLKEHIEVKKNTLYLQDVLIDSKSNIQSSTYNFLDDFLLKEAILINKFIPDFSKKLSKEIIFTDNVIDCVNEILIESEEKLGLDVTPSDNLLNNVLFDSKKEQNLNDFLVQNELIDFEPIASGFLKKNKRKP